MSLVSNPKKIQVKIANPKPGARGYTSLHKAREYEDAGAGYFFHGMFIFARGDEQELKWRHEWNSPRAANGLRACDPSPTGAAYAPWPETVARMGY